MIYVRLVLLWILGVPVVLGALVLTCAGFLIFTPFLILADWLVYGNVKSLSMMAQIAISPPKAFWSLQSEVLAGEGAE
ncbi:MAG: hypothetical protein CL583_13245 [Alteromonadaceae bacterium]|nr:hypothetical protein [Alteromonadaceae bacterium]|tara:strand:+ start:74 stop:307 length:234 start_codon:yes stop_codon:yes gene_type:complete